MIKITPLPAGLAMRDPAVLISTGLGSGRITPLPGTWGTFAAWILGIALLVTLGKVAVFVAMLASIPAGLWAIERFQTISQTHDARMIVIDEWAGIWITLLFCAPVWDHLLLGFFAFRGFDIVKPWPISWLDQKHTTWGVMADDLAAGLVAGLVVYGYATWIIW